MTRSILYVMAAPAEYGPALKARIDPLMTGIGPVEAAVVLTRALAEAAPEHRPQLVVSLGSAGSNRLEQGRVYQACSVSYRDMDASPLGFPKGITPLSGLPAELPLAHPIPGLPQARLSTGANVVSGPAYSAIDADMVDMETFAALRACQAFEIPLIALRGISDGAHELHHYDDWTRYLHVVDENLAAALDLLEAGLDDGALDL